MGIDMRIQGVRDIKETSVLWTEKSDAEAFEKHHTIFSDLKSLTFMCDSERQHSYNFPIGDPPSFVFITSLNKII